MEHVKGINWQVVHELLIAELERLDKGTSVYTSQPEWWKEEFTRMNNIAVAKAMEQQ